MPRCGASRASRAPRARTRGCVVGQRGARSSPHCRPGLNHANTAAGRWHGLRVFMITSFKSSGARPARFSPRGESADRPRSTRPAARTWFGCGVGQCRARSSPRWRPSSTASTLRQVDSTVFDRSELPRSNPVARVPRAFRAVENQPTAYGARAWQRGLGLVVVWANAGRAPPHAASQARPHQHRDRSATRPLSDANYVFRIQWRASRALFAPWRIGQPPTEHAPCSADLV